MRRARTAGLKRHFPGGRFPRLQESFLEGRRRPKGILPGPAVTLTVEIYSDAGLREFEAEECQPAKVLAKKERPR